MNIAINGFGRIGRITMRAILSRTDLNVVAINDLSDNSTLAHLFKYDSVHGRFNGTIEHDESSITFNGKRVEILSERDPANLPWNSMNVDVVIESTGLFRTKESAGKHLTAGAKQVVISAPAKDKDIPSVVLGVNDHEVDIRAGIISNASCTTNCAAPMVKVLKEAVEIESAFVSTIHAYTGDQRIHDAPHSDLRRARAAANSIIPTTTGAAKALSRIFPELDGHLGGAGIRVPVLDGSLTDLTCIVHEDISTEQVNELFRNAAAGPLKGIVEYTEDPIVSCDIIGNPHSVIFDSGLTTVIGRMVKLVGWYDNEAGYSNRMADLLVKLSQN